MMKYYPPNPNLQTWSRLGRWLGLGLAGLVAHSGVGQTPLDQLNLTSEQIFAGHFPSQDGWTIAAANRAGYVDVVGFGLDYQVDGGALIDGGTKAIALRGAANRKMNQWLTYTADAAPAGDGDIWFGLTFEMESIGTATDPGELFMRLSGWNLFAAVKLYAGDLEAAGTTVSFAEAGSTAALAGVPHRLVGRIATNETGGITSLALWLNPPAAGGDPVVTHALDGSLNVSTLSGLELRSQNVLTYIDNLKFGSELGEVLPVLPEDPGNLTVTLPADLDEGAAGIQVNGGTLFVEVDGAAYVAETPLAPGTEVTFRMVPDAGDDFVLTGWRGYKGPRGSVQPFVDFADATILAEPSDVAVEVTIPIYGNLNIRPIFEFGEHRLVFAGTSNRYRVRLAGNNTNQLRTLFDGGESITIQALSRREYVVNGWLGALSAVETNPVALNAGAGAFNGVLEVKADAIFRTRQWASFSTAAVIDPNGSVEFEALELGAAGSVPLAVMNAIVAEKAAQGLAGVLDFEEITGSGPLLFDPSLNGDMPAPQLMIARDAEGNGIPAESVLGSLMRLDLEIGDRIVEVRPGPWAYTELWGRDNLATEDGPGPVQSLVETLYYRGNNLSVFMPEVKPGANRAPTSGDSALGGITTYDFEFDAADKVVMSGIAYLSTANFQHTNENGLVTLWAQAVYDDGSTSVRLSSDKLDAPGWGGQGGTHWDHFFGFEAPAGKYITNIRVWQRGGNNRSFTNVDDLVVVLEGDASYEVVGSAHPEGAGNVTGSGSYVDGSTATLEAVPTAGYAFAGWTYASAPDVLISREANLAVTVNGPLTYIATFIVESIAPLEQAVSASGGDFMVEVTAAGEWAVESAHPWIVVTQVERVLGGGVVHYTVSRKFSQQARSGSLLIAGFTHTVNQAGVAADLLSDRIAVTPAGGDWYASDWLGVFAEAGHGYIFHLDLGWLNTELAVDDDTMYLWSEELQLWLYTSQSLYPFMYAFDETPQWIFLRVIQEQLVKFGYDAESGWTYIMAP